jgi:hypothetical protein
MGFRLHHLNFTAAATFTTTIDISSLSPCAFMGLGDGLKPGVENFVARLMPQVLWPFGKMFRPRSNRHWTLSSTRLTIRSTG